MPNINRMQLPDGNTYDLVKKELTQAEYDALTEEEKNNGTMYCITDSSSPVDTAFYGVCNTEANVVEKEVNISGFSSTNLIAGVSIRVLFINSNTAVSPTLNISGTGAKPIYRYGTVAPGTYTYGSWNNNQVISFTYDGTSWRMVDYTQYGWVETNGSDDSSNAVYPVTFSSSDTNNARLEKLLKSTNFTYNPKHHYVRLLADENTSCTIQAVRSSTLDNSKYAIVRAMSGVTSDEDRFGIELLANGENVSLAYLKDTSYRSIITINSEGSFSEGLVKDYIDNKTATTVFDQRTSNYGKFYFTETNGIKIVRIVDPKNLTSKAYTTLDFTLPANFRPQMDVYETLFVPSADDVAIRFNITTDGTVLIYNYSTATGTLNIANTMTYV